MVRKTIKLKRSKGRRIRGFFGAVPIATQAKKRQDLPAPLRLITSPLTTAVLGGTLVGLISRSPLAALKTFGATGLVLGALESSPKVQSFIVGKADPTKAGRFVGEFVEDPISKIKRGIERIRDPSKAAVITAGLGAGALAGAVAVPKIIEAVKKRAERIPDVIAQTPAISTSAFEPFGVVEQPKPEVAVIDTMPQEAVVKPTKITNTFKPSIDIRISKSKKFINQMNVIKLQNGKKRKKGKTRRA